MNSIELWICFLLYFFSIFLPLTMYMLFSYTRGMVGENQHTKIKWANIRNQSTINERSHNLIHDWFNCNVKMPTIVKFPSVDKERKRESDLLLHQMNLFHSVFSKKVFAMKEKEGIVIECRNYKAFLFDVGIHGTSHNVALSINCRLNWFSEIKRNQCQWKTFTIRTIQFFAIFKLIFSILQLFRRNDHSREKNINSRQNVCNMLRYAMRPINKHKQYVLCFRFKNFYREKRVWMESLMANIHIRKRSIMKDAAIAGNIM